MTQTEVAEALDWSPSKILRIENGQSAVAVSDLIALISVYTALEEERDELLTLAREARRPTIANRYREVYSPVFLEWLDYEAYAASIRQYEPQFVPGLLQLDDYAVPLVRELLVVDQAKAERIAESRRERSEPLIGDGGPTMDFILDESVIRRAAEVQDSRNGYANMVAQLEHLKKMNTVGRRAHGEEIEPDVNPEISIRIVPFGLGTYPMMRQAFEIIELRGEDEAWMMYSESAAGEEVVRDRYDEIADHIDRFSDFAKLLPGPDMTNSQIDVVIQQMRAGKNGIDWPNPSKS